MLISAVGDDDRGKGLLDHAKSAGIDISKVKIVSNSNNDKNGTATYTAVHDLDGDLCVSIADMTIFSEIDDKLINSCIDHIKNSKLVIIDGNLSSGSFKLIVEIANRFHIPVFFEPTSDHKCVLPLDANSMHLVKLIKLYLQLSYYFKYQIFNFFVLLLLFYNR
jgi:pseudouridine kinase